MRMPTNKKSKKNRKKCKLCDRMVHKNDRSHFESKRHMTKEMEQQAQEKMRSMNSRMYSTRPLEASSSYRGSGGSGAKGSSQDWRSDRHGYHYRRNSKRWSGGRARNHTGTIRYWSGGQADRGTLENVGHSSRGRTDPEPIQDTGHSSRGRTDPEPTQDTGHSSRGRTDPEPIQDTGHSSRGRTDPERPQFMSSLGASRPMNVKAEARAMPPSVKRCKLENESISASQPKISVQPNKGLLMAPSDEVSRMQLALELTVQEDGLRRKVTDLNAEIEKKRVAFDAMKRSIEQLEAQRASVTHEEQTVKEHRMQIIRDSYAFSTPSTITEPTPGNLYGPCSSSSIHSMNKQEAVEVQPIVIEIDDHEDDTVEVEVERRSISENITAKVRKRVMSQNESGSMSFADLDEVVSNLVNVSSDDEESGCEAETGDRRKRSETDQVTKTAGETPQTSTLDRSVDSGTTYAARDTPSVQTSSTEAKKKQKSRNGEQTSTASAKDPIRSVAACPGSIQAHNGEVCQLRLFRGHLFSGGSDGRIQCFDANSHGWLRECPVCPKGLRNFFLTDKPNGKPKIISFADKLMSIHDMKSGYELKQLFMDVPINCMTLSFFTIFIGFPNGAISNYDLRKNRVVFSKFVFTVGVCCLQTTAEEKERVLLAATADGKISVMNVKKYSEMRTIDRVHSALDNFEIQSIDDTVYTFVRNNLLEFPIKGNSKRKSRKLNTHVTSIITHNKRLVVLGCQDGSLRFMDVSQGSPNRMKVYYAAKRCAAITSLCCQIDEKNQGFIAAGNRNGQIFLINVSDVVKKCKVAGCYLDFEFEDDLICHVIGDHVLSSNSRVVRCLWNGSCQHQYSRNENREAVKLHIRSHL